jgi:hypothetical protein
MIVAFGKSAERSKNCLSQISFSIFSSSKIFKMEQSGDKFGGYFGRLKTICNSFGSSLFLFK